MTVGGLAVALVAATAVTVVALWGVARLRTQIATSVLDGIDEAVLLLDDKDRILWSSVEASRLFGVSLEGRLLAELLVEEDDFRDPVSEATIRMIGTRGELDIAPRWGVVPWRRGACRSVALRVVDDVAEAK
ncbi:MAG: PAS domain-containing protein [Acidobacteriota bacterium]